MSSSFVTYGSLLVAIASETFATSFLKQSEQFTKFWPSVMTAAGYILAFYCLSITLKALPVGVAYAIWSGLGIVLVSIIGFVVFKQQLSPPVMIGMGLIIAGVIIVNIFAQSVH